MNEGRCDNQICPKCGSGPSAGCDGRFHFPCYSWIDEEGVLHQSTKCTAVERDQLRTALDSLSWKREFAIRWTVEQKEDGLYTITDDKNNCRGRFLNGKMVAIHLGYAMQDIDRLRKELSDLRESKSAWAVRWLELLMGTLEGEENQWMVSELRPLLSRLNDILQAKKKLPPPSSCNEELSCDWGDVSTDELIGGNG